MAVTSGYGLNALSGTITLNLDKSQGRLQTDVSRLSSGLRINSAADDPSGFAIAERLQSKVNGYDQASSNVQTANNMLTVADGALQTVTDVLQRLRSLTVQANDDLLSTADRNDIQTESTQLQAEINTIAESTNFNGVSLLGRNPYAGGSASVQDGTFTTPSVFAVQYGPTGSPWTFAPITASGATAIYATSQTQVQTPPSGSAQVALVQNLGSIGQSISGFSANQAYTLSFNIAQTVNQLYPETIGVSVDGTQIATFNPVPTDWANPNWTAVTTPAFVPGAGTHTITLQGLSPAVTPPGPTATKAAYIDNVKLTAVSAPQLLPLGVQVQDGADEGDTLSVQLPTVCTANLAISTDTVADSSAAATYEAHIDSALDAVGEARATLGAQMVRLQYQAENDDTAAVNLTGSESNIRDANIAQTATAFAADQILTSIGTSVLANIKTQASLVEKLFQ